MLEVNKDMILVSGESLIDFTPISLGDEYAYVPNPGGSPYNVAVTLGKLGAPVSFFGKISYDPFGEILYSNLIKNNVDTSFVLRDKYLTTLAFVILKDGEPYFIFYGDNTADTMLKEEEIPFIDPQKIKILHFGSISMIREPGCYVFEKMIFENYKNFIISLDPNVRPNLILNKEKYLSRFEDWICKVDILKVSLADLKWLYGEEDLDKIAEKFINLGVKIFVVTLGRDGSIAYKRSNYVKVPGMGVKIVDTVGAGDSFMGGFLYYLYKLGKLTKNEVSNLSLEELRNILIFANSVAALTCTRRGANPPNLDEVEKFMSNLYY
jgi:fructokinase